MDVMPVNNGHDHQDPEAVYSALGGYRGEGTANDLTFLRHRTEFTTRLDTVVAANQGQLEKDKKFWSLLFFLTISLFSLAAFSLREASGRRNVASAT